MAGEVVGRLVLTADGETVRSRSNRKIILCSYYGVDNMIRIENYCRLLFVL